MDVSSGSEEGSDIDSDQAAGSEDDDDQWVTDDEDEPGDGDDVPAMLSVCMDNVNQETHSRQLVELHSKLHVILRYLETHYRCVLKQIMQLYNTIISSSMVDISMHFKEKNQPKMYIEYHITQCNSTQ